MMEIFLELLTGNTLTRVVLFPTLAALPLVLFPATEQRRIKLYTLLVSIAQLGLTLVLVAPHLSRGSGFQTVRDLGSDGEPISWIPRFGIHYDLAMDGISMPLVVLTSLLLPVVVAASWRGIERNWRGYAASLLLLTTGIESIKINST